jgi:hypothetical protein
MRVPNSYFPDGMVGSEEFDLGDFDLNSAGELLDDLSSAIDGYED